MDPLIIEEGQSTPKVILDKEKNKFEISGNSLPEDVLEFYAPVFLWFEDYIKQPNQKTVVHMKFMYLNSASSKVVLDLIARLEELSINFNNVEIIWSYLEMDEDMLSTGKEYESMLKIPFTFISCVQE
jgi:SiaC family regulatory phosphoprotein